MEGNKVLFLGSCGKGINFPLLAVGTADFWNQSIAA